MFIMWPTRIGTPSRTAGADDAFTDGYLRAGAVDVVTAAREQRERGLRGIEQPQHRVVDSEQLAEPAQQRVEQAGEVITIRHALGQQARVRRQIDARLRGRQLLAPRDPTQLEHPVNIRAAQMEHIVHADVARDSHELGAQTLEHRPFGFGALVFELQHDAGAGVGIVESQRGALRREHILATAIEELVRECDVQWIDILGE
jgi:hypothetical protein